MPRVARIALLLALTSAALSGCYGNNPFLSPQQQAVPSQATMIQERDRRLGQLDTNNNELQSQLALAQRDNQELRQENGLLRKQLQETATQAQDERTARQEAEQRIQGMNASMRRRGGATITANSSVRQSLEVVEVPGFEVRQEEDVIRIELPADQLFRPGTAQLLPTAMSLLDQVGDAVARNYPRQRIGIEGHTDNPFRSGTVSTSNYLLSSSQALAVMEQLAYRTRLSPDQMFVVAHGPNHPRASNGTAAGRSKNRRVELAIYPETVGN